MMMVKPIMNKIFVCIFMRKAIIEYILPYITLP